MMREPVRAGLIGKLPAHGDFVRRGPPAITSALEDWLDDELGTLTPSMRTDVLERLGLWSFAARLQVGAVAGALCASLDRVGRLYPLVIFVDGAAPAAIPGWAESLRHVLASIDPDIAADELVAHIVAASPEELAQSLTVQQTGSSWWQDDAAHPLSFAGLPGAADLLTLAPAGSA